MRHDGAVRDEAGAATRPRMLLAATILASSLSFIDGSVVNVGLPAIGAGFPGHAASLPWVVTAYLLPLSALVLLGGALGDRFGRRRLLVVGIAVFALASAACGAAPTLSALIAARTAQGAGAALLMPNSLAILGHAFKGAARGRAIGTWAAVGAATSGLGPLVGGWLIDVAGWRTVFTINLPIAAVALVLARQAVPRGDATPGRPLDIGGAALATLGLGLLTLGLVDGAGPNGWSPPAVGAVAGGIAVLSGFVAWERRRGAEAMMPLDLFASRSFVGLSLLTLLLYGALGALVVLLPSALMRAAAAPAAIAGAALMPITALLALLSPTFGSLAERIGPRPLLAAGSALVACGLAMLLAVEPGVDYWRGLFPALCVIGIGLAAAVAPLTGAVLASVSPALTGTASGFNNAIARTGTLVATACLGRVLSADGPALVAACHATAIAAAGAAAAAAASSMLVDLAPAAPARPGLRGRPSAEDAAT